ncbi:glycosyltransferase family 2 protein [Candidatus Peregrinibacteria bacterium]|nr:glycosyltransferase family 2 protein [Candidatus Peregrinibacteria bacterium]
MSAPKVTIGLVLYKGEPYLKFCLPALLKQDYPHGELLMRDQSPNGEAFEYVKREMPDVFAKLKIEKGNNRWHSGGHNALIRKMKGQYYFCVSQDMLYGHDFVTKIVEELEKPENRHFGSATCKLMRWDFSLADAGPSERLSRAGDLKSSKTDVLDSCGIGITKAHYFFDIGQNEKDRGQYDSARHVFGASGALAVYRKTALNDIAYINAKGEKEYFDELLHYKNDIDISYRLQWAGHPCLFIPNVKVYHDRQVGKKKRGPASRWVKGNSFFGQHVVLMKNYSKGFSLSVRLRTSFRHLLRQLYTLCFEPYLLRQYKILMQCEKEILAKKEAMPRRAAPNHIESLMQ